VATCRCMITRTPCRPFEAAPFTPTGSNRGDTGRQYGLGACQSTRATRRLQKNPGRQLQRLPVCSRRCSLDLLAPGSAGEAAGQGVPHSRSGRSRAALRGRVVPINADGSRRSCWSYRAAVYADPFRREGRRPRPRGLRTGYVPGGNILLLRWGQQQEKYSLFIAD